MRPETKKQGKDEYLGRRERVRKDAERYGGDVLRSEVMQKAFEQRHHRHSTVGDHTYRVTRVSARISYALQKMHIPVDLRAVFVSSLCHDLGIIGRDEKYTSKQECYEEHPKDSVAVARELVPDLPDKTAEIIRRHMWPMRRSKAPDSIEGVVVSVADKYSSVIDFVKGSRSMRSRNHRGDREAGEGK